MTQYINKDAVLAEIEKLLDKGKYHEEYDCAFRDGNNGALYALKSKLTTLEVKEVDLEEEMVSWRHNHFHGRKDKEASGEYLERVSQLDLAKHFFELGLNASSLMTWEDIDLILDITDQIANDDSMEEKLNNMSQEKYCTEVLKRLKAQKGE